MGNQIRYFREVLRNILIKFRFFSEQRNRRVLGHAKILSYEEASNIADKLSSNWKEPNIAVKQDECVNSQLADYRKGYSVPVFDALTSVLIKHVKNINSKSILEIGCSTGYNAEVLKIKGIMSEFTGSDYSKSFVEHAQNRYPSSHWDVEDAVDLSYKDSSFDIVISGCCILHIFDFEKAISEASRVSREYVVFHRTPVIDKADTTYYLKNAYGIDMLQIHFNEHELMALMNKYDLTLIDITGSEYFPYWNGNDVFSMKTYIMKKIS